MKRVLFSAVAVVALMATSVTRAQDPVKVDPKHYAVVFENNAVRVLHIHYAPGEKSVMHSHPDSVAVFLDDQKAKMTPGGAKETGCEIVTFKVSGDFRRMERPGEAT